MGMAKLSPRTGSAQLRRSLDVWDGPADGSAGGKVTILCVPSGQRINARSALACPRKIADTLFALSMYSKN